MSTDWSSIRVSSAGDLPQIVAALYRTEGLRAPVILDRPAGLDPVLTPSGAAAGIEDGRILLSVVPAAANRGRSAQLQPGEARTLAAALACYADHVEAQPDPADVEELAAYLAASRDSLTTVTGGDRDNARDALRWMRDRQRQGAGS